MSGETRKETLLVHGMNASLALVIAVLLFFDVHLAGQLMFFVGTVWLAMLLIVPRLRKMRTLQRWDAQLLHIARNSKWVGIWTGLWFLAYGIVLGTSVTPLTVGQIVTGGLSIVVFLTLMMLSNSWSYQHIKNWKHISMLVWTVPPLALAFVLSAKPGFIEGLPFWTAIVVYPLAILLGLTGVFVKKPDYFAKIRLIDLLIGLLIGVVAVLLLA